MSTGDRVVWLQSVLGSPARRFPEAIEHAAIVVKVCRKRVRILIPSQGNRVCLVRRCNVREVSDG